MQLPTEKCKAACNNSYPPRWESSAFVAPNGMNDFLQFNEATAALPLYIVRVDS